MPSYYKAVIRNEAEGQPTRTSFMAASGMAKDVAVTYPKGEWTYPRVPGSKLLAFESKQAAIDFAYRGLLPYVTTNVEVWKCQVSNPEPVKYLLDWVLLDWFDRVETFWSSGIEDAAFGPEVRMTTPFATVGCDAIKLTGRAKVKYWR